MLLELGRGLILDTYLANGREQRLAQVQKNRSIKAFGSSSCVSTSEPHSSRFGHILGHAKMVHVEKHVRLTAIWCFGVWKPLS